MLRSTLHLKMLECIEVLCSLHCGDLTWGNVLNFFFYTVSLLMKLSFNLREVHKPFWSISVVASQVRTLITVFEFTVSNYDIPLTFIAHNFVLLPEEEKQQDATDAPVTSLPVSTAIPTTSSGLDMHTISSTKTLNYRSWAKDNNLRIVSFSFKWNG